MPRKTTPIAPPAPEELFPEPPPPVERSVSETVEDMAHVILTGDAPDAPLLGISDAFDMAAPSATLKLPPPSASDGDDQAVRGSPAPRSASGDRPRPATRKGRPAGAEELSKLFAAGTIMLIAFTLGDWAQPTAEEANDLAAPLGNILARRIDVAAKLGKDANDTIAFTVAVMAYMVRVGPVAVERARTAMEERRARAESNRVTRATNEPTDTAASGRVPNGEDASVSAPFSPTYDPFASLAKARDTGLGNLDRSFGYVPDDDHPVGH